MAITVATRRLFPIVVCVTVLISVPTFAGAEDAVRHVHRRSGLDNSRIRFEQTGKGRVAFLGGSITEMHGYRVLVMDDLRGRFPETEFEFINAGIASTCSTTGAFRLQRDVLSSGRVDLLFVEFAVNDDQDAHHGRRECIRGMEGILRQARMDNARIDIVITHFVNPEMLKTLQEAETPLTMAAHEQVAEYYQVSTIALAAAVAERIDAGALTWDEYGGTHPAARGHQICADMITSLFDDAWSDPLIPDARPQPHPVPDAPIDEHSYYRGRFVPRKQVHPGDGWRIETPAWAQLPGQCRDRFRGQQLICADAAGAKLSVEFSGTAIGAYLLAGPDAGVVLASIDDGPAQDFTLYHSFSRGLHYPRTVLFAADLNDGPHVLKLQIAPATAGADADRAARIIDFVVN